MRRIEFAPISGLLSLIVVLGIVTSAVAFPPPPGKGGGKTDPPVTYLIHWSPPDFQAGAFNDQEDVVGGQWVTQSNGESIPVATLLHGGSAYDVGALINDPTWDIKSNVVAVSNRNNGVFYLAGYGLHNGNTRGFRLKLTESVNGAPPLVLEMLDLGVIAGDTRSTARAVNSHGDVAAGSRDEDESHELFLYTDSLGKVPLGSDLRVAETWSVKINEIATIVANYSEGGTGDIRILRWHLIDGLNTWGGGRSVYALNNFDQFAGRLDTVIQGKGKKIKEVFYPFVFDGVDINDLVEFGEDSYVEDINDSGDLLLSTDFIYLSEFGQAFDVWSMLDSSNSPEDINALSSFDQLDLDGVNNNGVVQGTAIEKSSTPFLIQSFLLIPVVP